MAASKPSEVQLRGFAQLGKQARIDAIKDLNGCVGKSRQIPLEGAHTGGLEIDPAKTLRASEEIAKMDLAVQRATVKRRGVKPRRETLEEICEERAIVLRRDLALHVGRPNAAPSKGPSEAGTRFSPNDATRRCRSHRSARGA